MAVTDWSREWRDAQVAQFPAQKDCRPPLTEPHDSYEHATSTVILPNGSAACVSQRAPVELQAGMTLAWMDAWNNEWQKEQVK